MGLFLFLFHICLIDLEKLGTVSQWFLHTQVFALQAGIVRPVAVGPVDHIEHSVS